MSIIKQSFLCNLSHRLAVEYQTYEIVFRTMEPNSLLLWLENYSKDYDHFALVIVGGFLELSISRDQKLTARSKVSENTEIVIFWESILYNY